MINIQVDYIGNKEDAKNESEAFGIKIVTEGFEDYNHYANVTGTKANVLNWLLDVHHMGESEEEVKELYNI